MKSLALIGMSKNAGKTTVLNTLLALLDSRSVTPGLCSVGRDGETTDVVTDTPKPPVYVSRGTIFTTTTSLLPRCDCTCEILSLPGIGTPLGEIVIIRALSDGYIQLAGPSMNVQTAEVNNYLRNFGAELCIVDGAISRKSFASPVVTDAVILSAGAALDKNIHTVVQRTKFTCDLLMLEEFPDKNLAACFAASKTILLADPEGGITDTGLTSALTGESFAPGKNYHAVFFPGVITDGFAQNLIKRDFKNTDIVLQDSGRLFAKPDTYARLTRKNNRFFVLRKTRLLGVTVNPASPYGYSFPPEQFLYLMSEALPVPVADVMKGDLHDIFP